MKWRGRHMWLYVGSRITHESHILFFIPFVCASLSHKVLRWDSVLWTYAWVHDCTKKSFRKSAQLSEESRQLTCSQACLRFFCCLWLWFDLNHCVVKRMGSGCVIHSVSHWLQHELLNHPFKPARLCFLFALICWSSSACDIFTTVIIPYEAERERFFAATADPK